MKIAIIVKGGFVLPERPSEKYYRDTAKSYEQFVNKQFADKPFFKELAKQYGSPILELACGTGRISLMLAEAGYEIVGVDLSPEMLEIAREKLQKIPEVIQSRVTFYRGDITDMTLDQKFAMIIIPSSFKYLLTTDDQLACLKCVREHLQDTGIFILDLYPSEAFEQDGANTIAPVEIEGAMVTKTYKYSNDLNNQLRHWDVVVETTHPNGDIERIETESTTALIMPREADLLLKLAGFQIVEEYGDWDLRPYKLGSWRRILVLKSITD